MVEEKTQPQFIFWVKEAGVFRPAEPKMLEKYIAYDLEKNIELGEREISPESLNLVSSVYLGPVNIFQESLGPPRRGVFERLREYTHGVAGGIVKLAEDVAKGQDVPYFAVNVIHTSKDRTWKFTQRDDMLSLKALEEKHSSLESWERPREPTEFVLHPTAQLYVPRE